MSNNQVNVGSGGGCGGGSGGSSGGGTSQMQPPPSPHIVGASTTTTAAGVATASAGMSAEAVNMAADSSPRESGDDSEDESEILEESPCGRWLKRREEVDQRDVPGIDCVHLAMDTEEGVEVVWNEVQYVNLQELKSQEDKMRQVFDNLLQLDHQNIVKFHRYWTDTQIAERPRVIFITEYMSSGSLKQFLKRTKRNAKRLPLEAWRRWCTQILSALSYLHSCIPPVIHGNLTCDSIFIQHNGLVKIGSVVPDAVHYSVRKHKADMAEHETHHFMAPEYGAAEQLTAAVDIYAFGMCALEMAALEIQSSSGTESNAINEETILRTINSLEHDLQRDLIFKCLRRNPAERPSATDLLFHPLLFEVHSLKLLSAHCLVFSPKNSTMFSETVIDGMMQRYNRPDVIMAKVFVGGEEKDYRLVDVPSADKLEKFVEDVKFGVYPLTALGGKKPPHFRSRAASPERADSVKSATPEPVDIESRRIVNMMCSVKKLKEDCSDISMTILLRMDDKMNRQLTCQVTETDSAADLTQELVRLGFVHVDDQDKIQTLLEETLRGSFAADGAAFEQGTQSLTFSATINEHAAGGGISNIMIAASNNNNVSSDNNNAIKTTTTMAALNPMERNWSVADTEPTSLLQHQLLHQQQSQLMQSQKQHTVPSTSSLAGVGGGITNEALGAAMMYVPQEQQQQHHDQQQQQQPQVQQMPQQVLTSSLTHPNHPSPHHHPHHQQNHQQQQQQQQQQVPHHLQQHHLPHHQQQHTLQQHPHTLQQHQLIDPGSSVSVSHLVAVPSSGSSSSVATTTSASATIN